MQSRSTSSLASDNQPIDAVIAWVDGQDAGHMKLRAQFQTYGNSVSAPALDGQVNAPRRWSYAGELDICLRSIERHAPWMRKIFIITNGQIPSCLGALPAKLQRKIHIVNHEVIFRDYLEWLPTFNSMAIEAMMWRIPDLSERFIYFNDDMFLAAPVTPHFFFEDNKTRLFGRWMSVTKAKQGKFTTSIYHAAKLNAAKASGYNAQRFFSSAHVAMPMRVSVLKQIFGAHPEWISRNGTARFRAADQYLIQGLFAHSIMNSDKAIISRRRFHQNLSSTYCKKRPYWRFWLDCRAMRVMPKRFRLICVNDLSLLNKRFRGKAGPLIRKAIGL